MAQTRWMAKARARMEAKGTVGAFGRQAKRAGKSTQGYARQVLANKERYPAQTVKRANFARNAAKASRKR